MKLLTLFALFLVLGNECYAQFGQANELTYYYVTPSDDAIDGDKGDIDLDGDIDLIYISRSDNKIEWYENRGDGHFFPGQIITSTIADGEEIELTDLDNDGDLDIVATTYNTTYFSWFENTGNGVFGTEQTLSLGSFEPQEFIMFDADNDGFKDVIAKSDTELMWIKNNGNLSFGVPVTIAALIGEGEFFIADVNGDLNDDIVVTSSSLSQISWYENLGLGSFGTVQVISTTTSNVDKLYLADLDGDLDNDIIVASSLDSIISVYENLGGATFGLEIEFTNSFANPNSLFAFDYDSDGDKDVLVANRAFEKKLVSFTNNGSMNFSSETLISEKSHGVSEMLSEDVNGDGLDELIVVSQYDNEVCWYENNGALGIGFQHLVPETIEHAACIRTGDVNQDGIKDIVVGGWLDISYLKGLGNGSYAAKKFVSQIGNYQNFLRHIELHDFNGDNRLDIMACYSGDSTIVMHLNLGNGEFDSGTIVSQTADGVYRFRLYDFDQDGDVDIISGDKSSDAIGYYENLGLGVFGPEQVISSTLNQIQSVHTLDVNNDGLRDILGLVGNSTNKIVWFQNLGSGSFGPEQLLTNNNLVNGINFEIADFNNDGFEDIVVASYGNDILQWYQNMGTGTFSTANFLATSNGILHVFPSDLDLDGDIDIIASASLDNETFWLENLGGGSFGSVQMIDQYSVSPVESKFFTDDVDSDGDIDILSINGFDIVAIYESQFFNQTQIKGQLFSDLNQNGLFDAGDVGFTNVGVTTTPQSDYTFTGASGNYFCNFDDTSGTYLVENSMPILGWTLTTDSINYTINVDSNFVSMDSLDFGFYPDTLYDSLSVDLTIAFPSCSQIRSAWIDISNVGTSLPSGIVKLTLDDSMAISSIPFAADSVVGQSIYWSFDSLLYFSDYSNYMFVQMPDFNSMGDSLTSYLEVFVYDSLNNLVYSRSDSLLQIVACAYDPNDKLSEPIGIDSLGFIPTDTDYIEYTIRFQNTGTDTAHTVIITDQLDLNLDWQSLVPIASSHNYSVEVEQNGFVTFSFPDIELVDSNTNEPGSHGYIKFGIDINPSTPIGTSIYNTAYIYFDFNPPIITNTKILTLLDCEGILENFSYTPMICEGDSVLASTNFNSPFVSNMWTFEGAVEGIDDSLSWYSDTTGLIQLNLNSGMSFCNADTTFSVMINTSDSVVVGSAAICQNDSTLVFGNYVSQAGMYSDVSQNFAGCDSTSYFEVIVNSLPIVELIDPIQDTLCSSNWSAINLSSTPTGGIYSGNGTSGNQFDPSAAGVGQHWVLYTYTDPNNCAAEDSTVIFVALSDSVDLGFQTICENDSVLVFGNYVSQSGVYSNPFQNASGCDSIIYMEVIVNPAPVVDLFEPLEDTLCNFSSAITLNSSPMGGIYSGNGVSGNQFDPSIPGLGEHWIYYSYSDANNCSAVDSTVIYVDGCTSLDENEFDMLQIYPNPFNEYTNVDFKKPLNGEYVVMIYDVIGNVVYRNENILGSTVKINRDQISSGLYSFSIVSKKYQLEVFNTKLIVE